MLIVSFSRAVGSHQVEYGSIDPENKILQVFGHAFEFSRVRAGRIERVGGGGRRLSGSGPDTVKAVKLTSWG
jgi:hypothetical protein